VRAPREQLGAGPEERHRPAGAIEHAVDLVDEPADRRMLAHSVRDLPIPA